MGESRLYPRYPLYQLLDSLWIHYFSDRLVLRGGDSGPAALKSSTRVADLAMREAGTPMMMKAFLLTVAGAAIGLAQGALHPSSSYLATPTYKDVTKVGSSSTSNGWLAFDATGDLRFVPKSGDEVRIPYRSIKILQYEKAVEQVESKSHAKKSKWALPMKMNLVGKHQVTIRYDAPYGPETTTLWLDPSNYQNILGTLHAKTGLTVQRTGENSWQN